MRNGIQEGVPLQKLNTFGVQATAKLYVSITKESTLFDLYQQEAFSQPFFVLGGGSNVLFTQDYPGLIIHINNRGIQHFIEGNVAYVIAAGGEVWNDLVWYCVDRNFPGLENMALIPGTVGASPIQNIGAYGQELMHIFHSCRAFDTQTGQFTTFTNADCVFSYRDSIFKRTHRGRYIITSVTYRLPLQASINTSYGAIETELHRREIAAPNLRDIAQVVSAIRVEKLPDPTTVGNAGSFFKNPVIPKNQFQELLVAFPHIVHYPAGDHHEKIAAGWLIEQCGWKGKTVGQVAVWRNQALVLTNLGEASGAEIYRISSRIMDDVAHTFGITLEREVNIL